MIGVENLVDRAPDAVLSAHIGMPALLSDVAARLPAPPAIIAVDSTGRSTREHTFFRAPAELALPDWPTRRLVAAAAVVRPGGNSFELVCSDSFEWPGDAGAALRELERIILAHVDQWHPPRALWAAPAEILLPEVLNESG